MSVGIHIDTDFISTASLSSGGDFVFYEQIETPVHDAGALCRQIAELVAKSDADPAAAVSVAINIGFGAQPSPPNSPAILAKLDIKDLEACAVSADPDLVLRKLRIASGPQCQATSHRAGQSCNDRWAALDARVSDVSQKLDNMQVILLFVSRGHLSYEELARASV